MNYPNFQDRYASGRNPDAPIAPGAGGAPPATADNPWVLAASQPREQPDQHQMLDPWSLELQNQQIASQWGSQG